MATWQTKVGPIISHWTPNIRFLLLATHLHGKVISPAGQTDLFIQPSSAFQMVKSFSWANSIQQLSTDFQVWAQTSRFFLQFEPKLNYKSPVGRNLAGIQDWKCQQISTWRRTDVANRIRKLRVEGAWFFNFKRRKNGLSKLGRLLTPRKCVHYSAFVSAWPACLENSSRVAHPSRISPTDPSPEADRKRPATSPS